MPSPLEVESSSPPNGDNDRELQDSPKLTKPTRMRTIASVAGNVLEWYDFAVFGFFADILGELFFPPQEGNRQLYESFALFGGAFLMRPIGGIFMGWIGDTYGRKKALEISIFLMAFPTFAMGCLPTYDAVGNWAVIFLTIVRLLQGLSVGGQLVSSLVYTLEHQDASKWGLYGSFVLAAANFGTLLGGLTGAFLRGILSDEELRSFGWRLPFLAGILVSFFGIYLRCNVEEDFHHGAPGEAPKNPLKTAFASGRTLAAACLVPMLWSAGFYLTFVWLAIFMNDLVVPPVPEAFWVNSVALLFSVCLFFPVAGSLSDRAGRVRVMTYGGIAFCILSPLMISIVAQGNAVGAFFAQSVLGLCLSLWGAPMMAWLVEAFPPDARVTSVAIGYNIAQAIMGGSAPTLATLAADAWIVAPGFVLTSIGILSLIGLHCVAPAGKASHADSAAGASDASQEEVSVDPNRVAEREIA